MLRSLAMTVCLVAGVTSAQAAPSTEAEFIAGLEGLPDAGFGVAIEAAFRAQNCVFDFTKGEDPFLRSVAVELAKTAGYKGALTQKSVDAVEDLGEDAIDAMMEDGRVVVDRSAGTASLKACK